MRIFQEIITLFVWLIRSYTDQEFDKTTQNTHFSQNYLSCYHSLLIFVLSSTNSSGVLNNINLVWSFRMKIFVSVHLNKIEFHRNFSNLLSLEGSHLESWHRFFCILAGFLRLLFPSSLRLEKGLTYTFFKEKSNKKLATFEMIFEKVGKEYYQVCSRSY